MPTHLNTYQHYCVIIKLAPKSVSIQNGIQSSHEWRRVTQEWDTTLHTDGVTHTVIISFLCPLRPALPSRCVSAAIPHIRITFFVYFSTYTSRLVPDWVLLY